MFWYSTHSKLNTKDLRRRYHWKHCQLTRRKNKICISHRIGIELFPLQIPKSIMSPDLDLKKCMIIGISEILSSLSKEIQNDSSWQGGLLVQLILSCWQFQMHGCLIIYWVGIEELLPHVRRIDFQLYIRQWGYSLEYQFQTNWWKFSFYGLLRIAYHDFEALFLVNWYWRRLEMRISR